MIILIWLTLFFSASPSESQLQIKFIGNAAFELSDGSHSVLSDFPYTSGAFGYMTYVADDVSPNGQVLNLITHHHRDHFAPALLEDDWTVAAAPGIDDGNRPKRLSWADTLTWGDFTIIPVKTPHTPQHHSYLVRWNSRSFYFTGDTESTTAFPQDTVDVFFITPWLLDSAKKKGRAVNARKTVIHHHRSNQRIPCDDCIVPVQGDMIELP